MDEINTQKNESSGVDLEEISKINDALKGWSISVIRDTSWCICIFCFILLFLGPMYKNQGTGVFQKIISITGIASVLYLSHYKNKKCFDDEHIIKTRYYTFLIAICWSSIIFSLLYNNIVLVFLAIIVPFAIKNMAKRKHSYLFRTLTFLLLIFFACNLNYFSGKNAYILIFILIFFSLSIFNIGMCEDSLYKENLFQYPSFGRWRVYLSHGYLALFAATIVPIVLENKTNIYIIFPWAITLWSLLIEEVLSHILKEKYELINKDNVSKENTAR